MASVPIGDESTLDEPILETLLRDLKAIGRKMAIVAIPMLGGDNELRDWDLWGPLLLCMILAMILGGKAGNSQGSLIFVAVFILVSAGSAIVTLNAKFLGARLSFFQIVCVLGYCIAPMVIAAVLSLVFPSGLWYVKFILAVVSFFWSTYASLRFFNGVVSPERRALILYPLGLFYFFLSWMLAVGL